LLDGFSKNIQILNVTEVRPVEFPTCLDRQTWRT